MVRLAAPVVRPWNPPRNVMIASRPVVWRESFIAPSTASAPLFPKNTVSSPRGVMVAICSASAMLDSYFATPVEMCMRRWT